MREIRKINEIIGAPSGTRAVEMTRLSDSPVVASALLTTVPAVFGMSNIGRLAVNIVANRLLAAGAEPRYISASVTVDIDTPQGIVEAVAMGMRDNAIQAEMEWTTVDTAVKAPGPSAGIAISAFGIGSRLADDMPDYRQPEPGDTVIITGEIGALGTAIEGARRGIEVLTSPEGIVLTDVMRAAYSHAPCMAGVAYPIEGVTKALESLGVSAEIDPDAVPVNEAVATGCSIMGLNPLELSTAAAMVLVVGPEHAAKVLDAVHRYKGGERAAAIGTVTG